MFCAGTLFFIVVLFTHAIVTVTWIALGAIVHRLSEGKESRGLCRLELVTFAGSRLEEKHNPYHVQMERVSHQL